MNDDVMELRQIRKERLQHLVAKRYIYNTRCFYRAPCLHWRLAKASPNEFLLAPEEKCT